MKVRRQDAAGAIRLGGEHGSGGAVAEDDGDVAPASRDVDARRVDLTADQQHVARPTCLDELIGDGQTIDEPGALILDVERGRSA